MDRTLATLDAQFETLDAHVEGVGNAEAAVPELAPFVRETATAWPSDATAAPLPENEDDTDRVILGALVRPSVGRAGSRRHHPPAFHRRRGRRRARPRRL